MASFWAVCFGSWGGGNGGSGPGGASTCWGVELKYRARMGRRNVGGSEEEGIRVSRMDRRRVRCSMVRVDIDCGEQLLKM